MRLNLTSQQRRLLEGLSEGYSLREAAFRIGITWGTAKVYMAEARRRNGAEHNERLLFCYGREAGEAAGLEVRANFAEAASRARENAA